MITMQFDITPRAQARPRAAVRKGRIWMHKSPKAEEAELDLFYLACAHPNKPPEPLDGPLTILMTVALPKPKKSAPAPVTRPDLDNYIKLALDVLTRAGYWKDDKQIVKICACKKYVDTRIGHWRFIIREFDPRFSLFTCEFGVFTLRQEEGVA